MKELLEDLPKNKEIFESFLVAKSKMDNINYENVLVSISGGSDSDIMLDIIHRCDTEKKAKYIWFDTGLEYQATKEHLKYLEEKYGIEIIVGKPTKAIPTCCKEFGQPFLSKLASEYIERLQRHNFQWEDESFEVLYERYPKCKSALRWWTNTWGENSKFNIKRHKLLKEFMIQNPPPPISNKCCKFAKKDIAKRYKKENKVDLNIVGVRKAEGGARSSAYKNCFTVKEDDCDEYRPIFWYKEETKRAYEEYFDIQHSKCYSEYGLKRTGCAGCPFGRDFEFELEVLEKYEPKMHKAVTNIFKDSYEYTRQYRKFREEIKK